MTGAPFVERIARAVARDERARPVAFEFADLSLTYDRTNPVRYDVGKRDALGGKDAGTVYLFVHAWRFTLALEFVRHEPPA